METKPYYKKLIDNGIIPLSVYKQLKYELNEGAPQESYYSKNQILAWLLNRLALCGYSINIELFDKLDSMPHKKDALFSLYAIFKTIKKTYDIQDKYSLKKEFLTDKHSDDYLNAYKAAIKYGYSGTPYYTDGIEERGVINTIELVYGENIITKLNKIFDSEINHYNISKYTTLLIGCLDYDYYINTNNIQDIQKVCIAAAFLQYQPNSFKNVINRSYCTDINILLQSIAVICDKEYNCNDILNNKIIFCNISRPIRRGIMEIINILYKENDLKVIDSFNRYNHHWKYVMKYLHPFENDKYANTKLFNQIIYNVSTRDDITDKDYYNIEKKNGKYIADNLDRLLLTYDTKTIISVLLESNQDLYTLYKLISFYSYRSPIYFSIRNNSLTDIKIKERIPLSDEICFTVLQTICQKIIDSIGETKELYGNHIYIDQDYAGLYVDNNYNLISGTVVNYTENIIIPEYIGTYSYYLITPDLICVATTSYPNIKNLKGIRYSILIANSIDQDCNITISNNFAFNISKSKYQKVLFVIDYEKNTVTFIDKYIDVEKLDDKQYISVLFDYLFGRIIYTPNLHLIESLNLAAKSAELVDDINDASIVYGLKNKEYNLEKDVKLMLPY